MKVRKLATLRLPAALAVGAVLLSVAACGPSEPPPRPQKLAFSKTCDSRVGAHEGVSLPPSFLDTVGSIRLQCGHRLNEYPVQPVELVPATRSQWGLSARGCVVSPIGDTPKAGLARCFALVSKRVARASGRFPAASGYFAVLPGDGEGALEARSPNEDPLTRVPTVFVWRFQGRIDKGQLSAIDAFYFAQKEFQAVLLLPVPSGGANVKSASPAFWVVNANNELEYLGSLAEVATRTDDPGKELKVLVRRYEQTLPQWIRYPGDRSVVG